MSFQVRPLVERPAAHGAFVWGLVHVEDLVYGERTRLAETFAALGAFEWLFFTVDVSETKENELGIFLDKNSLKMAMF